MTSGKRALRDLVILIKGAGEMASGIAHRLFFSNIRHIVMTEISRPLAVRRTLAFCEAVYDKTATVEGVTAQLIDTIDKRHSVWGNHAIAVLVDPDWNLVKPLRVDVVIDAIMAKRNIGTTIHEAPLVIGVGPGFTAQKDVHVVIESNRGHDLGRVLTSGSAEPYTGIPGAMEGITRERVLRSPHAGTVKTLKTIGDTVEKGENILYVDSTPVTATISGMLRGLIREIPVEAREKLGDIDPRGKKEYCYTVSDKARAIGGGILETILYRYN